MLTRERKILAITEEEALLMEPEHLMVTNDLKLPRPSKELAGFDAARSAVWLLEEETSTASVDATLIGYDTRMLRPVGSILAGMDGTRQHAVAVEATTGSVAAGALAAAAKGAGAVLVVERSALAVYVMSNCSDSLKMLRDLLPVWSELAGWPQRPMHPIELRAVPPVHVRVEFIRQNPDPFGWRDVEGDRRAACADALFPGGAGGVPFLACMMGRMQAAEAPAAPADAAHACALELSLDSPAIEACATSPLGEALLNASFAATEAECGGDCWAPSMRANAEPLCVYAAAHQPRLCPSAAGPKALRDYLCGAFARAHGKNHSACTSLRWLKH